MTFARLARRRRCLAGAGALLALLAIGGCGSDREGSAPPDAEVTASDVGGTGGSSGEPELSDVTMLDPELAPLGTRLETYQRLCARGRGDSFARALCDGDEAPLLAGMSDVLALVGLDDETQRAFALTGNSTSLVSKSVSAINPRIIIFPRVGSDLERPEAMTAVGFVRGEQFVELVSRDLETEQLNFYLVSFERNCSYDENGCDLASLLSEEIEHDWTAYSVYDQDDLEGTSFDCLSCHQPGSYGSPRILRMQELESPWLHWFPQKFGQRTESDRELLAAFSEAHEVDGQYGGIPTATILNALDEGSGAQLEALLRAEGFGQQPNPFNSVIAAEMSAGETTTYDARFAEHLSGTAIAVPYPGVDVTDPTKRSAAVSSYRDVVLGAAPRESMIDIRDVFSEDAMFKLSFVPWSASDGRVVLNQMCARCHDGRGNPALAKNQFDVLRLEEMSRDMKDAAIARLTATGLARMPPARVGELTPDAVDAAIAELEK